jgi:hypothetical protein
VRKTAIARRTGQYERLELLGEGGVGQVYAARDRVLGRQVAIKTLRPQFGRDRDFLTRFYGEAQRLGELNHPNITTLYALHLEGQEPFMVMELVRGQTLEALLAHVHRLPLGEALAVVAQAASGLTYAHRMGIIHRDIKPANLMVSESGLLKIMDFGIARVRGSQRLTRAGQMFGTLLYASPEQIRGGDVSERSDLYSLAVVFYELLAGTPPFRAENDHALMTAHLDTPPPPLSRWVAGIDGRVDAALMRALAKKPEDRFTSVEEFGRAVGATAVRGEAPDILQTCFATALRDRPAATRLVTAQAADDATQFMPDASSAASLLHRGAARDRLAAPRQPSMRLPIALLGAVAAVLLMGLGYVALGPTWSGQVDQQAREQTLQHAPPAPVPHALPPPAAPRTATEQLAAASPPPPGRSATPTAVAAVEPPKAEAPPTIPPATASQTNPSSAAESPRARATPTPPPGAAAANPSLDAPPATPPPVAEPPTSLAALTLRPAPPADLPAAASPGSLPTPASLPTPEPPAARLPSTPPAASFVTPAPPKPDLHGTVSAVKSASRIRVDGEWIDLYGVDDPTSNQASHVQAMISYLKPSHGNVECFRRAGDRYQCYANGVDLAVMAVRGGIARRITDASSN